MRKWFWPIAVVLMSLPAMGQTSPAAEPAAVATGAPPDAAPLDLVIAQVKAALDQYQKNLGTGPDALPPLTVAEFDFKTITATVVGGSVSFFIFKIGGSHEKDVINDVTYAYSVPPPPKPAAGKAVRRKRPPTLTEALASTLQGAAAAVKTSGTVGKLKFSKLTANIQYGVKWDGNIGANVPIQFVTIGLSGDESKNTVQSVKLVFGQ